jgi:hypothetical protein
MKLSQETLEVLKNFSSINQSLLIKSGNTLSTISNLRTILSIANVQETFPTTFAIYDLNKFLAKHSLYKDCDLEFEDDRVIFQSSNKRRHDYIKYCSPKVIVSPPDKKLSVDDPDFSFELTHEDLEWQRRSAGISGSPNFVFRANGEDIKLVSTDIKDDSSDISETVISNVQGVNFNVVMKAEYFKILDGDYLVDISRRGLAKFTNLNRKIEYFIAIESAQSTFE